MLIEPSPDRASVRVRDLDTLKALGHPVRRRLMAALRLAGPATATGLGARLGESSGSASYHLRELARAGLVEELPERGTARERWWQAAHRSTSWRTSDFPGAEGEAVVEDLTGALIEQRRQVLQASAAQRRDLPTPWRDASSLNDVALRLTAAEASELAVELTDLLVRWRDRPGAAGQPASAGPDGDSPDGRLTVAVFADVLPLLDYPL